MSSSSSKNANAKSPAEGLRGGTKMTSIRDAKFPEILHIDTKRLMGLLCSVKTDSLTVDDIHEYSAPSPEVASARITKLLRGDDKKMGDKKMGKILYTLAILLLS